MKKLILLTTILLAFACSKDDNGASSNSDPLIGTWLDSDSNHTWNFQSNGRLTTTEELLCIAPVTEVEFPPTDMFWAANEENPDFTKVRREYRITSVCDGEEGSSIFAAVFSDDFNTVKFNGAAATLVRQ